MKRRTARTFIWTAGILIVLGFVIMSPSAAFTLFLLAATSAAVPSIFASEQSRSVPVGLLVLSIVLAASFYPAFTRDQEAYARRVKERMEKQKPAVPAVQGAASK
jgi:membrane protein implicated in regulation of membrane protease activity